jgi:hypothetical protein
MTDQPASTAEDRAIDALTRILDSANSPEMLEAQQIILRRLALSGDLFPSRIPAPPNITQVGGYLNLIADDAVLRAQVLASALGVAGPNPSPGWEPTPLPIYLAAQANDRPSGTSQPTIPVTFCIRSDFAAAFDAALASIHDQGGTLPVLAAIQPLPPAALGAQPPDDLLPYLGRVLDLVPATAPVDPASDPLALGQQGAGPLQLVALQLDPTAPGAGTVTAADWSMWSCTSTACSQVTVNQSYIPLTPILNAAGWYQPVPAAPVSLLQPGSALRWTNVTGLVTGTSRFGDELALMRSSGEIAQSIVRERLDWVWDGSTFASPG